MAKPPAPSDIADKFMLRLPDGMRDRIAEAAKTAGRSMNAEIVHRLQMTFGSRDIIEEHWDAPNTERRAALGDMIDMMMIVREYLDKLPPDVAISRRKAVELSLNSVFKLEAQGMMDRNAADPDAPAKPVRGDKRKR